MSYQQSPRSLAGQSNSYVVSSTPARVNGYADQDALFLYSGNEELMILNDEVGWMRDSSSSEFND